MGAKQYWADALESSRRGHSRARPFTYASIAPVIDNDGDMLTVLDVLAKQVGVLGVFSDWPATTTYYANCMGL